LRLSLLPTNMAVTLLFVVLTVAGVATGRYFYVRNSGRETIWIGVQGNPGMEHLENGGFLLFPNQPVSKWVWNLVCKWEVITLWLLVSKIISVYYRML
jgi:hypothetical protein